MDTLSVFRAGAFAAVLLCFAVAAFPARADTLSFTGNLRTDATVTACGTGCMLNAASSDGDYAQFAAVVYSFNLGESSTVQATSFSYGGGVNGAGATIAEGGLEPYLSLFDSAGAFLFSTFSGTTCPAGANTNSSSGECFDVQLDAGTLAAGTYSIALSAFENMSYAENYGSGTLLDGFTGLGNLYPGEDLHYAFDLKSTPASTSLPLPAVTPEPPSLILLATALALVGWLAARRGSLFAGARAL